MLHCQSFVSVCARGHGRDIQSTAIPCRFFRCRRVVALRDLLPMTRTRDWKIFYSEYVRVSTQKDRRRRPLIGNRPLGVLAVGLSTCPITQNINMSSGGGGGGTEKMEAAATAEGKRVDDDSFFEQRSSLRARIVCRAPQTLNALSDTHVRATQQLACVFIFCSR
jgi:hypothetical protein